MWLHLFILGEGLVWVMFDDMSTYDIHLWQNWAKWDIALVLKNLTEHWLSCLVGLGWFLFFFNFFFSEILSFKARLAFVWYPKFWAETVEWRVPILVEHSAFKIYLLLLRRFPTVTHLTLIQICWYQYHHCTSHNEASVIVLAEFALFTHTLLNVSSFTM